MSHIISDALELLTAQHDEIDDLVAKVKHTGDTHAFDALADKLVAHLALEQELFYPVIAATITQGTLGELLQEHVAIKHVLGDLVWVGVDDPTFLGKLANLEALLLGHCRWQEEELFQNLAETMSTEWLHELGSHLLAFDTEFPLSIAA